MKIDQRYPEGDVVWIASDGYGHVGAFITAGVGPIPCCVVKQFFNKDVDLENEVCGLAQVSEALSPVQIPSIDALAERGFFVYDWQGHNNVKQLPFGYEIYAIPTKPILLNALPLRISELTGGISFAKVDFANISALEVHPLVDCHIGGWGYETFWTYSSVRQEIENGY